MSDEKALCFDAVCFDLDGTLLNTLQDIADAANEVLLEHGCPTFPTDDYRYMIGDGVVVLFQRALPPERQDPKLVEQCAQQFRQKYAECWNVHTRPYPGVPELLDELTGLGVELAVLSNKPHHHTVDCVEEYLGRWPFRAVVGQREDVPPKPDPRGARLVLAKLGLPPHRVLYLGDTPTDMQTARTAGMFPVGALWGYRSREELLEAGAAALVEEPAQVLALLHTPSAPTEEAQEMTTNRAAPPKKD